VIDPARKKKTLLSLSQSMTLHSTPAAPCLSQDMLVEAPVSAACAEKGLGFRRQSLERSPLAERAPPLSTIGAFVDRDFSTFAIASIFPSILISSRKTLHSSNPVWTGTTRASVFSPQRPRRSHRSEEARDRGVRRRIWKRRTASSQAYCIS